MTQEHLDLDLVSQRLRELLDEIKTVGWTVSVRVVYVPEHGPGRITVEMGQDDLGHLLRQDDEP